MPKIQVKSFNLIKVDLWTTNVLNVFAGGYVSVDKQKPIKQNKQQETQCVTRMSVFCGLAALSLLTGIQLSCAASLPKPKVGVPALQNLHTFLYDAKVQFLRNATGSKHHWHTKISLRCSKLLTYKNDPIHVRPSDIGL